MPLEFGHEALAEAHDLLVALALGIEVRAALGPAHGQGGEAVFQNLLKAQKFQNGQVHGGMEPEAPLIGPDGGAELHPVAPVHVDVPLVVHPGHPEGNDPLGLHKVLHNALFLILGMLVDDLVQALQELQDRLVELLLVRVPGDHLAVDALQILAL